MAATRVLFIDPDAASRRFVAAALKRRGYEVELAGSGEDGLHAAWRQTPSVIVVDPAALEFPGEQLAARLREDARTARVPLIVLSGDLAPARIKSYAEAGFSDFLLKSPEAMPGLLEKLAETSDKAAQAARTGGLLIVFLSAKGGTGTSSLCANLATNMAEEKPTASFVVADLVLPLGSIAGIVGYEGPQNLVSVAHRRPNENTQEFLRANLPQTYAWRFQLLAGPLDPEGANQLDAGGVRDLVATLKAAYDVVILDLGRSLSRISLPLIKQADLIAMITGTDLSTVTLSKAVWAYLRTKGVRPEAVYAILNRAVGLEGLTKSEAEEIIGLPIRTTVPYLGGSFTLANNQHTPYCVKYPAGTASIIFRDAAREMAALAARVRTPG